MVVFYVKQMQKWAQLVRTCPGLKLGSGEVELTKEDFRGPVVDAERAGRKVERLSKRGSGIRKSGEAQQAKE